MDYETLVSQHDSIDSAIQSLLALLRTGPPQPSEASRLLGVLAVRLRDHLAIEDPVIYETVAAARGTRHGEAAALSASDLDQLKDDWARYLARWDKAAVAAGWTQFVDDSFAMLARVHERVKRETAVLYSLAYHHEIIGDRC